MENNDELKTISEHLNAIDEHLKQWNELGLIVKRQLDPIYKQQEQLQKIFQSIFDANDRMQKSMQLTGAVESFTKATERFIEQTLEQFYQSFDDLHPRTREAILLLCEHGWYFDADMDYTSLLELKDALQSGNQEEAEKVLIEYFESKLDEIERAIIELFPDREKVIKPAFSAHRRQEYELSIPVLLSQTDGITKELIGDYFFSSKNNKPRTAKFVEQLATDSLYPSAEHHVDL